MLPFGSYDFFIIMAGFIAVAAAWKLMFKRPGFKHALAVLNAFYLFFIYPRPLHFILLIFFAYAFTYLSVYVFRFRKKIWGILILLLPMLIVKSDIRFDFYPFHLNDLLSFAGLSYASFRIMGYYMDLSPDQRYADPFDYFNFLSFTPTLLIGPIDRFARFKASQDNFSAQMNAENFMSGWNVLLKGIAFKYIIAEVIDRYWLNNYPASSREFVSVINNMYAYYLYLFFDFAGYSHMAFGIAKMMGMTIPVNFTNPFAATNPQDFWRRFHISLGDWLRDYFFTPLFLFFSRKKSLKKYPLTRQNISLFMTFLLMGCWNGFQFNFILSGILFGIYSAVHNTYTIECKKSGKDIVYGNLDPAIVKYINVFIMFNLAAFALYIFSGRCPFL